MRATAHVRLFGLSLLNASPAQAIAAMLALPRCRVAFVNAHCVNVAFGDSAYRSALDSADMLLPDGIGMAMAARLHGLGQLQNLNGTDLCPLLLREAARRGLGVYLLGGQPGVAEQAAWALTRAIPDLRIVGHADGFDGAKPQRAIPAINATRADIVLVGMGVPQQDLWLACHHEALDAPLVLGVGAYLDFASGRVPRAPQWLRRVRLEWLWRLGVEPRRMFRRYVIGNVIFLWRAWRAARGAA